MTIHQYSEDARRRIARAVRWVETRTRPAPEKSRRGRVVGLDRIVIAQADIEHGQIGDVKHLSGSAVTSLSLLDGDTAFSVYNPRDKVWAGVTMFIREFALPNSDSTNLARWYITQAWSATMIRGKASADIAPGGTGLINNVFAENGNFLPTTASVYLPTEHVTVHTGVVCWAKLVFRADVGSSRWEIYSADCPEAG